MKFVNLKIISFVLLVKISLLLIGIISIQIFPFQTDRYQANFAYPKNENVSIAAFKTWDAQHYLYLSQVGYKKNDESVRFFPLFPALIALVTLITHNSLISSYILTTIFSVLSVLLLYRLTLLLFKSYDTAKNSIILLLFFPTAFFLTLPYTESLYLFLVILFFYLMERNRLFLAIIPACLVVLSRPTGVFIMIPLLVFLYARKIKPWQFIIPTFNQPLRVNIPYKYLLVFIPLIGVGVYLLLMNLFLGDPLAASKSFQKAASMNIANLIDPGSFLKNLLGIKFTVHEYQTSIIDRIFYLFSVCLLPVVYKKMSKPYFYFTLSICMIPLLGSFSGFTRYIFTAFPLIMVISLILTDKKLAYFKFALLYLLISLQTLFFVMHILNFWVA